MTQNIIDLVVNQIKKDISEGNSEALEDMLAQCPEEVLIDYLPE